MGRFLVSLVLLAAGFPVRAEVRSTSLACSTTANVLVLADGSQMKVRCYGIQDNLVLITTPEGKLLSVPRALVDLPATERLNGNGGPDGHALDEPPLPAQPPAEMVSSKPLSSPIDGWDSPRTHAPRPNGAGDDSIPAPAMTEGDDADVTGEPVALPLAAAALAGIDGPAPPEPPDVMTRDDRGRTTLRAVRIAEPLTVDGKLEESVYRQVPAITGFIQQEPKEGNPATEQTEVWVVFDHENVYISARCWDSHPERMVANEMRRDNHNLQMNDHFAVALDTFYDRRNGFLFYTNPIGGLFDGQITDEMNTNSDWNTIWDAKTGRFPEGWTVEMKLPFKSLRYKAGESQIWGINFRRSVVSKNELSYLTPIAAAYRQRGLLKLSQAATLVGIEPPARSMNLEVKPFVTSGLRTDLAATEPFSNDFDADVGFDTKYGLTRSLMFDFTYHTDFAQVEDDEQQVNLTRFSLFFPEKRDFFLEGQGIFNFAGRQVQHFGETQSDTPILFFSRRIGLIEGEDEEGEEVTQMVPLNAGGRLTGRAGKYTVGALAMQTGSTLWEEGEVPTTNFGVVRLKRDIFGRSNFGFLGTYRSESLDTPGSNTAFGVDGNFSFYENLNINTYWARTATPGLVGDDSSYMGSLRYGGDKYGVDVEHLLIEENFNPEVGFLRREDMRKSSARFRFSPRPRSIQAVRRFSFEGNLDYITDNAGVLETRVGSFEFRTELQSGDNLGFQYTRNYEFLDEDFEITDDITIPIGGYSFEELRYSYRLGPQRRVSGWTGFQHGTFYSGHRKQLSFWGRIELNKHLSVEPDISVDWVDLAEGNFTSNLFRARVDYMFTPRAFLGALIQYNSTDEALFSNIRFRWEYIPGSDLFVVYSDGRDTSYRGFPMIESRSLVFKLTRLFRF